MLKIINETTQAKTSWYALANNVNLVPYSFFIAPRTDIQGVYKSTKTKNDIADAVVK